MATSIYQKGLQLFIEAEEHGGANGSVISTVEDLSAGGRDLVCSADKPTVKTGAINSKRSFEWDGTQNPLVYNGAFTIRCGFLLVKVDGNFTGDYQGILSSPLNFGILVGIGGSDIFYDFLYDYYEFRLNDHIYPKSDAPAPIDAWGLIYFKFWQNLTVEGIQLGQDRDFTDRKFDGEVALMALYDRDFCEEDVRKMTHSIANSYQLALPDVFPYQGSKEDGVTTSKRVLTDGQDEPVTRVKRGARKLFDLNFSQRRQDELFAAERFWNDRFPQNRFIYRDYETIPPRDTVCRFPENSEFQRRGGNTIFALNYGFQVFESVLEPAASVPSAPSIPDDSPPSVTLSGVSISGSSAMVEGTASDNSDFAWLQLFVNGAAYGSPVAGGVGAFSIAALLVDLNEGNNSFFVTATDAGGSSAVSNSVNFDATPDPYPPSIPEGLRMTALSPTEILIEWLPGPDEEASGAESDEEYLLVF
jgi:hypothetical protein